MEPGLAQELSREEIILKEESVFQEIITLDQSHADVYEEEYERSSIKENPEEGGEERDTQAVDIEELTDEQSLLRALEVLERSEQSSVNLDAVDELEGSMFSDEFPGDDVIDAETKDDLEMIRDEELLQEIQEFIEDEYE